MKKNIFALLLFVIIALAMTYPLAFKINDCMPGFFSTDETYGAIRQFWWYKYAWLHKVSYQDDFMLNAPFGFKHERVFLYPMYVAIAKSLSILANPVFAYNFVFYLNMLLAAFFMFLLVYYLTKDAPSSVFAAICYAFCPYYFARAWQHLGLTQIQWFPLYILALLKLRDKVTFVNALFAALAFSLLFYSDNQYAYFMFVASLLFMVFVFAYQWKTKLKAPERLKNDLKILRMLLAAGFLAFLVCLPALRSMVGEISAYSTGGPSAYNLTLRPFEDLFAQSAKFLSYLLPAAVHPVFGNFTQAFIGSRLYGISFTEHTLYLGWVPLILAFIAFQRWRKRRVSEELQEKDFYIGFFIFLAVSFWLFSQPPWWNIGRLKVYLPAFFMYKVLPMFRAYCRFGILVMFSVAVLAGLGLSFILKRFKTRILKMIIAGLFSGFVLFEFWNYPPFKVIDVSGAPEAYFWLKREPGDFAIAEYPLDINGVNEMYKLYQTKHEKKIINGTIPGTYADKVARTIARLSDPLVGPALKWMGVKYVFVHRQDYLKTDMIQDREELEKIPRNPAFKLIKAFSPQECASKDIICTQRSGAIDVYEVLAGPVKPALE